MSELKRPQLIRDWENGFVKAKKEISNGWGSMPANTIYHISSCGITAHLESHCCEECGFKFKFTMKGKDKFKNFEWLGYEIPNAA